MNQIKSNNEKTYIVKSLISRDGCGSLYTIEDHNSLLRVIDDSYREKFSSEIFLKNVEMLSSCIGENNLAIPNDFVKHSFVGYTFQSGQSRIPLSAFLFNNKDFCHVEWMRKTGAATRRIKILLAISEILEKIHQSGFVVCNLSPSNILLNKEVDSTEVFLASTEWICYKAEVMRPIYTERYTAPEVASGFITNSYSSDCYSFALLVYDLLDYHPITSSVITADNIEACRYIAPEIKQLLVTSLIKGRENINRRPDMSDWKVCLEKSLTKYISCPKCGVTYPYVKGESCPECGAVSDHVYTLVIRFWNKVTKFKNGKIQQVMDLMDDDEYKTILNPKTPHPILGKWFDESLSNEEIITISVFQYDGFDFIHITPRHGYSLYVSINPKQTIVVDHDIKIRMKKSDDVIMVGLKDLSTSQNVMIIDRNGLFN